MPTNANASVAATTRGANSSANRSHTDFIRLPASEEQGKKSAPYARDIEAALARGASPNVYLFGGARAWERAKKRRETHGPESTLVLPPGIDPLTLRWPCVDSVLVAWPKSIRDEFDLKLRLAQALIRDGVRVAIIEHDKGEWLHARAKEKPAC